jgi:hypothetical protein
VRPGETYFFSAWTNIPPTSKSLSFAWQVRWRDAGGAVLSTVPVKTYAAATDGWVTTTAALVAPPNAAQATIRQVVGGLNATAYVDDVRFGQ